MTSIIFRVLIVAWLALCYPLAQMLPVEAGWENGLVENTQVLLLLSGALVAFYGVIKSPQQQWRWFWSMAVFVWLLMAAREVSWGTVLLTQPAHINPETGPVFSSFLFPYHTTLRYGALALVLFAGAIFVLTKQHQTLLALWRKRSFPLIEMALVVVAAVLSSAAEGHSFFDFAWLSEGRQQTLEELFELGVYLSIYAAQVRVLWRTPQA